MQTLIVILLGGALYAILKLRYRRPVLAPLGWKIPTGSFCAIAILGGVLAALAITCVTQMKGQAMPAIPAKELFVLGVFLGPILEESVFRGYLLPVLGATLRSAIAVIVTATLFAAFHAPSDITHWVWFSVTGLAYGWLRVASATTTASAIMHASCNLTLVLTRLIS